MILFVQELGNGEDDDRGREEILLFQYFNGPLYFYSFRKIIFYLYIYLFLNIFNIVKKFIFFKINTQFS